MEQDSSATIKQRNVQVVTCLDKREMITSDNNRLETSESKISREGRYKNETGDLNVETKIGKKTERVSVNLSLTKLEASFGTVCF